MRNVIAALVAIAAVGAVVWFGWTELSTRTEPQESGPGAEEVLGAFATAWSTDDTTAMEDLVHPDDRVGLDGFLSATDEMRTSLDLAAVSMSIDEVDETDDRAVTSTSVTVTLADLPGGEADAGDVGTIGWLSSLEAIQRRSGWFVRPDRASLHPQLAGSTRFERREVDTPRASILAVDGTPLTIHGDLETLGISPGQIRDREVLVQRWAEVLPQSVPLLEDVLARDDLEPDWFYPVVSLPSSELEAAWSRLRTLAGVIRRSADEVSAPTSRTTASHVVGSVGPADEERATELGVEAGTTVGVTGLERAYETQLVGSDTVRVELVSESGEVLDELGDAQVDPSSPLSTSLDADVQAAVESALLGIEDPIGVVAVRADGGIAASASRPLSGYNRAWEGRYPPGDVFMPITAATMVRSGVDMATPVECPPEVTVSGADAVAPAPFEGQVQLGTALAAGCDTTIATAAVDLAPPDLVDMAARFGWGAEPALPLAAATPTFPEPVDETELVRAALGQARVETSVLQLASVAASSLSGQRIAPWLVVGEAGEPERIPIDTTPIVDVMRQAAVDGSGATVSSRDVGVIVGTAPVTGDTTVHAWAMMVVDDLGIVVLAEDTDGEVELARTVMRRIEGELVGLGATGGASPEPSPGADATPATGPSTAPDTTPSTTPGAGASPGAIPLPSAPPTSPSPEPTS
ncbi:penicillin-binding transpeptidase domain-containing protein [Salsipaludibacter albus]|uniref:penicillin-binding transpeptidase domain-containing protein n=1 Tax=Salsipaludibacter albus TaxID=2849650 RepID=UPI001EE48506|nr:penicillin-binding transpeptidase domain-containing protein [Salsipaludibacter albus]MBY5160918.1 hypothetical protein [Salsipaludibacter albus]